MQETVRTFFRAFTFMVNCGGLISVLLGFVYLTEAIEKHQGIDVYAVGFFLCFFIDVATVVKLFQTEDIFGIADSTMALTVFLLITFKDVLKKSFVRHPVLVWIIAYAFEIFKMAPIRVRNDEPVPPIQDVANVPPIPPIFAPQAIVVQHGSVVCKFWKSGLCNNGVQCLFLHSWSSFPGLVMKTTIRGHKKVLPIVF